MASTTAVEHKVPAMRSTICLLLLIGVSTSLAEGPFSIKPGTMNSRLANVGVKPIPGVHSNLYRATDNTYKFCHHANLVVFHDQLYCMWSNGVVDEDAAGQRIVYRSTSDGEKWSKLQVLTNHADGICVAAGFHVHGDQLIAYYTLTGGQNFHPNTALMATTSKDGLTWTEPKRITEGFYIEGPYRVGKRLVMAGEAVGDSRSKERARFLYTDDPSGLSGWKKANIRFKTLSRFGYTEPSFFTNKRGMLIATLRNYSGYLFATTSENGGQTWSDPQPTNLHDTTARTSAGNLTDGRAFLINNALPNQFDRGRLVVSLSRDGITFDQAYVVRAEDTKKRYEGKHKLDGWQYPNALQWKEDFYIAYSINKEDVAITRVPVARIASKKVASTPAKLNLGDVREEHVMIPMRDGKRLSAYVYKPNGTGPWPVIFEQRYGSLRGRATRLSAAKLAAYGYVVGLVNYRGAHLSEGTWVAYRALQWGELQDGYDACEWFAKQSWSTGKVGTFGSSQGGYAQNYLAVTQPPHLVCQYMTDTGLSLFHEGYRIGGGTRPDRFKGMDAICRVPLHNRLVLKEWFQHPTYDDYWKTEDCTLHFDKMNVPCFTIGSWYDFMNQGSIASFQGRQHKGGPRSRNNQQLIIGPWLHGRLNKGNRVGELTYPENAAWPVTEHMVKWFDYHIKGKANDINKDPPVRYYVMGAVGEPNAPGNVWRDAKDFPPKSRPTPFYLHSDRTLTAYPPTADQSKTDYISDPLNPMSIPGLGFPGARDARPFEEQKEVLTFTTPPLKQSIEWTGRVHAELYVSSTAKDTDFIVRVSDVYPDGRSILIIDYPWRARYREGFEQEKLMEPGKKYKVAFPVGWISQIFNAGHRIRVTVASTGAPLYEPNPQNGKPLTIEFPKDAQKATNSIYHQKSHASRIIAPLMNN